MPILNLDNLDLKTPEDIYYMESLSIDNLESKTISQMSKKMRVVMAKNNHFSKFHNGALSSFDRNQKIDFGNTISFQAHDLNIQEFKVDKYKETLLLKSYGYSFGNQTVYETDLKVNGFEDFKCLLKYYNKGDLVSEREADFNTLYEKYPFELRDILMSEDGDLKFILISFPKEKFSSFGERMMISLSFKAKEIDFYYVPEVIPENKKRNKI